MDPSQGILFGLGRAMEFQTLLFCFLGVLWGTLIGVLPGIGPTGGLTILLPLTSGMDLTQAMVMMAGVYYGTMYGGSTTSILCAVPGETASVITVLDGHQMAKKGRAGAALALAAIGSFVAGTIAVFGLAFLAPTLASLALDFGPPEYFTLALLGLSTAALLSNVSLAKGLSMAVIGLMVGTVGMSVITGYQRYTFGRIELISGVEIIAVLMGLFGVAEVMETVAMTVRLELRHEPLFNLRRLLPNREEMGRSIWPMLRGGVIGFFVGALPGSGGALSSYVSYAAEKKLSKHPEQFGTGAPEGVAGPEAANNAGATGALIPLLTLGVPYSVVTAIMLSAMVVHGVFPSPLLMQRSPEFFWTVVSSMYIGNVMLLVLNLPLVGIWAALLRIPQRWLVGLILVFCLTGVYAANFSRFDLLIVAIAGGIGVLMKRAQLPAAPLALGMILGPILENALMQSLILSHGSPLIFVKRPLAAIFVALLGLALLAPLLQRLFGRRVVPTTEEEM